LRPAGNNYLGEERFQKSGYPADDRDAGDLNQGFVDATKALSSSARENSC